MSLRTLFPEITQPENIQITDTPLNNGGIH